jgi:hypothetical protein
MASRALGFALDLLRDHGSKFDAAPRIARTAIFRFPSKKGVFYDDRSFFPATREQSKFHIFCHFYHRSSRGGFPGRGIFGC